MDLARQFLCPIGKTSSRCRKQWVIFLSEVTKKKPTRIPSETSGRQHGRVQSLKQKCRKNTLDGSEIRRAPVEVGSLSRYLPGFYTMPPIFQAFFEATLLRPWLRGGVWDTQHGGIIFPSYFNRGWGGE